MTTGNEHQRERQLTPEEREEMLAWCGPSQEATDALFAWTIFDSYVDVCLLNIKRVESELDDLKKQLSRIKEHASKSKSS